MTDVDDAPDEQSKRQPPKPHLVLAVLVRREGRVRISARDIAALHPRAKIDMRMDDQGNAILTYREPPDE